eukprot:3409662-Rhodomonas_salina.2
MLHSDGLARCAQTGSHTLQLQEDGGGVALLTLSRLSMTSNECTPDCLNLRDNGSCNAQCLQPGCSFDQGQCTYRQTAPPLVVSLMTERVVGWGLLRRQDTALKKQVGSPV